MIHKDSLKNKFITYLDKDGKYRTHKVVKVTSLTLTVKDALGVRHRIHPKTHLIFGRQLKKEVIPIQWAKDDLPLKGVKMAVKDKTKKVMYND